MAWISGGVWGWGGWAAAIEWRPESGWGDCDQNRSGRHPEITSKIPLSISFLSTSLSFFPHLYPKFEAREDGLGGEGEIQVIYKCHCTTCFLEYAGTLPPIYAAQGSGMWCT